MAAVPLSRSDGALGIDLVETIGRTPLLRLDQTPRGDLILAKAEWFNPGGSVKDRPAAAILQRAIADGRLTRDRTILDATSGNTGIAYAMLAAAWGYDILLCLPANASPERKRILRALGARLHITDPLEGSDGAIRAARRLLAEAPDRYFYADQYGNDANWRAHYETTGPEIWRQTQGRLTHFVATVGTSGTLMGTGRYLREQSPAVRLVEVQPDSPFHGLEGMKHMESAIVPPIYDPHLADERRAIATETAYDAVTSLARTRGLLVGISSGAAYAAARQILEAASADEPPLTIVTLFPDGAAKYLSDAFWDTT